MTAVVRPSATFTVAAPYQPAPPVAHAEGSAARHSIVAKPAPPVAKAEGSATNGLATVAPASTKPGEGPA